MLSLALPIFSRQIYVRQVIDTGLELFFTNKKLKLEKSISSPYRFIIWLNTFNKKQNINNNAF